MVDTCSAAHCFCFFKPSSWVNVHCKAHLLSHPLPMPTSHPTQDYLQIDWRDTGEVCMVPGPMIYFNAKLLSFSQPSCIIVVAKDSNSCMSMACKKSPAVDFINVDLIEDYLRRTPASSWPQPVQAAQLAGSFQSTGVQNPSSESQQSGGTS